MSLLLADRSNWNSPDDYPAARAAGLVGVWLKVGQGGHYSDPTWGDRAERARAAGLRVGGYYYVEPGGRPFAEQAQHFAGLLGRPGRRDLRPVCDLETLVGGAKPAILYEWVRGFMSTFRKAARVGALLYGSWGFLEPLGFPETVGYGLWLAAYGPNDGREHAFQVPHPWRHAVAHQFTSEGHWPGLQGHVDLTVAHSLRPLLAHPAAGLL